MKTIILDCFGVGEYSEVRKINLKIQIGLKIWVIIFKFDIGILENNFGYFAK